MKGATQSDETTLLATATVSKWAEVDIPSDMKQREFEAFLRREARRRDLVDSTPYPFLVKGTLPRVTWHVVTGTSAGHGGHGGAANAQSRVCEQKAAEGILIGFYSDERLEGVISHTGESPRQRHDADAAHAQAPAGEASLVPLAERALGLEPQPQPGDLDHHGPHPAIARLADALVALAVSAVVGCAHQARKSRHFTSVAKAPPAEELHHQQPGAGRPDRPQVHQLHDAALGIGLRFAQPLAALGFKRGDLALH